jgi:DNA excision repair protein ERCC-4
MKILVDTREQAPYFFQGFACETEPATLETGDYSLPGFEDRVGVERKELNDLINCLMGENRTRFEKELRRLSRFDLAAVVVESTFEDIFLARYKSEMKPQAALQSIFAFQVRHGVAFMFCGNRRGGEYVVHALLSKYFYEIEQRFKQASAARGETAKKTKAGGNHGASL